MIAYKDEEYVVLMENENISEVQSFALLILLSLDS